jgi:hypothetical protein
MKRRIGEIPFFRVPEVWLRAPGSAIVILTSRCPAQTPDLPNLSTAEVLFQPISDD